MGAAEVGREARGGHGLGASLGHGNGVASRGSCRGHAVPGELIWGESRGGQCGLGLGLGTCPPRWPAPAYGVAGGRGAGRKEVEDSVKCSFVIKPNCSVPCKLKFSPCSRGQTKNF